MEKQRLKIGVGTNSKAKYVFGIGPGSQKDQTHKKTRGVYLGRGSRLSSQATEGPAVLLSELKRMWLSEDNCSTVPVSEREARPSRTLSR